MASNLKKHLVNEEGVGIGANHVLKNIYLLSRLYEIYLIYHLDTYTKELWKQDVSQIRLMMHISLESNLDKFLIPKIPKTDLQSSQTVESDGTLGKSKTKNVPIFYTYL